MHVFYAQKIQASCSSPHSFKVSQAAEMKEDTGILLYIKNKDWVAMEVWYQRPVTHSTPDYWQSSLQQSLGHTRRNVRHCEFSVVICWNCWLHYVLGEGLQSVDAVEDLACDHGECDASVFLHAQHATQKHHMVVIKSPDTDLAVIVLSLDKDLPNRSYFHTGVTNITRITDLAKVMAGVCVQNSYLLMSWLYKCLADEVFNT